MDRLLFDLATSYLGSAAWLRASGHDRIAHDHVARAAELLADRTSGEPMVREVA